MLSWLYVFFFFPRSPPCFLISSLSGDRRTAPFVNVPEGTIHGAMQEVHHLPGKLCAYAGYHAACASSRAVLTAASVKFCGQSWAN
jgi:hypothetical protein